MSAFVLFGLISVVSLLWARSLIARAPWDPSEPIPTDEEVSP